MNRRHFLSLTTAAAAAASINPSLSAWSAAPAGSSSKLLVLVHLKGGNDPYNTFVPFDDPHYYQYRPTIAVPRADVIQLHPGLGLHPAMRALLPMWEAKDLALVQGIGQQEVHDQHYRDLETQFTGSGPTQFLTEGWLTRAMAFDRDRTPLHALAFGDLDIRVSDPMGPFRGDKLRVINVQHPSDWLTSRSMTSTPHVSSTAAQSSAEKYAQDAPIAFKAKFGDDEFSQALFATAQLAAAGIAPPVVHITMNADSGDQHHAFDTHWVQLDYHAKALARLANGLAAFREAMIECGKWSDTLLATYDEFGRSPRENEDRGTHHGWASVQMVAGGRVAGGLVGEPLPVANVFSIGGARPVIDYRSLYTTLIQSWWGQSARGVFERDFKPITLLRA